MLEFFGFRATFKSSVPFSVTASLRKPRIFLFDSFFGRGKVLFRTLRSPFPEEGKDLSLGSRLFFPRAYDTWGAMPGSGVVREVPPFWLPVFAFFFSQGS